MRRRLADGLKIAILAAAYIGTGQLALLLAAVGGFAAPVWPPTGIALAALLVFGRRLWPGIAIGALVVNLVAGAGPLVAAAIAIGNTLEAIAGAWALGRLTDFRRSLDRLRDVMAFVGLAAVASPIISATIGVTTLELAGIVAPGMYLRIWTVWWWGDFAGALLVAPLLFTWSVPSAPLIANRSRRTEIGLLVLSLFLVGGGVFYGLFPGTLESFQWPFLVFPLLMWAALRFGPRAAASANVLIGGIALSATAAGQGPFVGFGLADSLLHLQAFLSSFTFASLALAAVAMERARELARTKDANRYLGAILEAAPDAVVTMDDQGVIREFNSSAERLFGIRRAAALGTEIAAHLAPWQQAPSLGERMTLTARRADGREFPAEVIVIRIPVTGAPLFTGFIRDLSTERAAQAALLQSQEELEASVVARTTELRALNVDLARREDQLRKAQALARIGSFTLDPATGELRCSEQLYRLYGKQPGSQFSRDDLLDVMVPEDREEMRSLVERGGLVRGQPFRFDARIERPEAAPRTLRYELTADFDAAREVSQLIGTCVDLTEQRRTESLPARLAAIVESSTDAIVSETFAEGIDTWNRGAETVYGYSAEEMIGQPVELLVPVELRPERERLLERVRRGERLRALETVRQRKDGSRFDAWVSMSPILNVAGRVIGVSTISRDISDRKAIETAMQASLREKDVLLREIHHRVKNNLQVIASLLHLQSARMTSDEVRRAFDESDDRIQSMALVHQLLYTSRRLASIDFGRYLANLVERLGRSFGVEPDQIEFHISAADIRLDVDSAILLGLMVNELVSNALKHAFPGDRSGRVDISLRRADDGGLALTVEDDGIGLPAATRLDTSRSLGLQIVHTLASQLHGTVEVGRTHGTKISITMPPRNSETDSANHAAVTSRVAS